MGSVPTIALRYLIFSEKILQSRKLNLSPTLRTVQLLKNFTSVASFRAKNSITRCLLKNEAISSVSRSHINLSAKYNNGKIQSSDEKESYVKTEIDEAKLSKWQRLKKMYKEYWYIAVPVHLVTSAGWFGAFYYVATSGFDIVGYMESFAVNEMFIKPFRDSSMGYFAVAYALYKIFTPLRYTVTLGGTTFSINYLKKRGYIKPVPSKTEIKKKIEQKKDELQESFRETKKGLQQRKQNISDDIAHYRSEMKSLEDIQSKTASIGNTKKSQ